MKIRNLATLAAFAAVNIFAAPVYYSTLLSGPNENPPTASPGTGVAVVSLDTVAHLLTVDVTFAGLTAGNTAAHIHCCVNPPGNVGVATQTPTFVGFPTGATSGVYSNTFDTTLAATYNAAFVTAQGGIPQAEAALAAAFEAGRAYFNIHTSNFPGGEIRGFLAPIPEPGTFALLGAGLLGLFVLQRRLRT